MKYLKTYETYTSMNYPDLYDEPVPDFVEVDYYTPVMGEEDETEPPNKTGYEDRESKNTRKKAPQIFSVA